MPHMYHSANNANSKGAGPHPALSHKTRRKIMDMMLSDLRKMISINSVCEKSDSPDHPFGEMFVKW